jgi:molybdenum cofactor sulfurtransferase
MQTHVYGNPHSANPSSTLTGQRVEEARDLVLRFFNAVPAEYQVVFTKSATGALQTVGETFPWHAGSVFRCAVAACPAALLRCCSLHRCSLHRCSLHRCSLPRCSLHRCGCSNIVCACRYALQHGARFQAVEEEWVESWISGHKEDDHFVHPAPGTEEQPAYSLFAFPAEENFSGKKYPLRWIKEIQVRLQCALAAACAPHAQAV